MIRFSTIRRRLLLGAGFVLVLSGFTLMVAHTGLVRRFVLVQIQARLGNTMGLVLDAKELDYNLLVSRFELKEIAVRGARLRDMPAPLKAQRVAVKVPVWQLLRGSLEAAQIQIDGLSVDVLIAAGGQSNLPAVEMKGGGNAGGPSVLITGGSVMLRSDRDGYRLHLPIGRISAAWDPGKSAYGIVCDSSGGQLQWNGSRLALDQLQLKSAAAKGGFTIESLRLTSGESEAEISAALSGSPARIEASANLKLNMRHLSQVLALSTPVQGRMLAHVSAAGLVQAVNINAALRGEDIVVGGFPVRDLVAEALVDSATGEVQLRNLSAGVFSGRLKGSGRFPTTDGGRSELTAGLDNLDVRQVARAFGYSGAPNRRASMEFTVSGPGLDWRRAAISGVARMQSAKVAFHAAGSGNSVRASLDTTLGTSAAMHGDVTFRFAGGSLTGEANGQIDSLARFGSGLEHLLDRPSGSLSGADVDGAARWSAVLGGTDRLPTASLQLQVNGLSVGGWTGAGLQAKASYGQDRIAIESARLEWGGQRVDLKGTIGGLSSDAPLQLDGTVEGRSLAGVFESLGAAQAAEGSVSGQFQISGSVGHPAAEASLHAGSLTAFGQHFADARLDARWKDGELTVDRLAAEQSNESGTPGRLQASGSLTVAAKQYEFDASARDFQAKDVAIAGAPPLSGTFQFKAHGKGSTSDPVVAAEISGAGLKIGSTVLGELAGKVDAAGHRATALLALPALNAKASSTIAMEGAWPFELTLDAQKTHLETSPAVSFDAAIHANGTLSQPHVERVTAGIQNLRLALSGEEILSDGPVDLSYTDGRIQVRQLALKSGASTLRVSGEMPLQDGGQAGSVSLQGSLDLAPLSKLLPASDAPRIGGILDVNASVAGSAQNWQPGGSITVREGQFRLKAIPFPFENITGRLNLEGGTVRVSEFSGKAGTGNMRLDGSVPLGLISNGVPVSIASAEQTARFSVQFEKLMFSGGSGEHPSAVTFDAKIEGEASALSLAALRATAELTSLEAQAGSTRLQQASPTRITIADNVARLEQLDLRGEGSSLKAAGSLSLTGSMPLQLEAAGQTDLAVFAALAPSLEAAGTMRMDVRVGGTLSDPKTSGFVELERASLMIANPPIQANNIKLRADMEADRITVNQLSGNLNGGTFQGGGDLKFGATGIRDANVFLKAKDVFAEYPASVKTTSSVDVKLVSRQDRVILEGQIEVQEGYLESTLDIFSKSGPDLDKGAEGLPKASRNPVALDLKIVTKRQVEMDNNLGRLSAAADLRLAGTTQQPRLTGTLKLEEDGRLYFGDRTYYIERGTVRFLDAAKITPELDIQAYTPTGDYTIRLGLKGELDEITTTFTSDPPLSRDDVIAVLLTGKTVAENRGVDLRALEATSLATGALNASLSSQMHRTFGVSRVSIAPSAIAAESNPGARVTITQDFTRTFRLLYSMNLSDSNDQIWVAEYDLSRHFTTRAVKQSDNTYRGEFRHDIRFGEAGGTAAVAAVRAANQKISELQFTGATPFAPEQLAKIFKVKAGQQYKPIKVRQGSERLAAFFGKQGYLESRVRLDREDTGQGLDLTVRIELGPIVDMAFHGAELPKKQVGRLRRSWLSGISDQQRPQAAKVALLGYFADKGYLRAEVDFQISGDEKRKSVRFDLKPGTKYQGVKIVVEGAERQRARDVLSLVEGGQLKQSVYRNQARVAEAVTAYYQQRGYLAAKVAPLVYELDADRRTGRIVIPVQEGPAFHVGALQFSGNQALTAADLQAGLQLEPGAVFEPARLEPALAALKLKYGKLGYREADVEYGIHRHDDRASVDVSFTVNENRQTSIGGIKVEGNRRTSTKYALSQLRVKEGQVANTQLVRESVKNLSQTGAYTTADIHLKPIAESGADAKAPEVADLVVGVAEPKPFRLLYGALYDSGNGPGFIADLQNYNMIGAGRVLGLRARVDSETDEIRVYVTQPTLRSRRLSTTLGTYYTRETEDYQTTPTEKLGVSLQQDVQLRSKLLFSYGYRYEKQRGFVPDPASPPIPESIVTVAPITLTLTREARDSYLDATRGSFVSHGFELAPGLLGSDYPYLRYYGQYFKYFPLTKPRPVPFGEKEQRSRLVFATGSRVGMQKGFNSTGAVLTDRFYAGGGTTVRGFRQDELGPKLSNGQPAGGNAVLVLNEELRYPLFWIFDAVTFVDIGNVFPRVTDFRVSDLRAAAGFGLRIRNPFVVLRFDYGFKFGRRPGETMGAFFFSIGQAF